MKQPSRDPLCPGLEAIEQILRKTGRKQDFAHQDKQRQSRQFRGRKACPGLKGQKFSDRNILIQEKCNETCRQ